LNELIERWLPIPGYEGRYDASSFGQIRSRLQARKILKQYPKKNKGTYLRVWLYKDGKRREHEVHRLIALTFHGKKPPGLCIRHLNGDDQDNHEWNLKYGTRKEDHEDRVRHGTSRLNRSGPKPKGCCPKCGGPYTKTGTLQKNQCRPCRARYQRKRRAKPRASAGPGRSW
jgi:hypothetical protein